MSESPMTPLQIFLKMRKRDPNAVRTAANTKRYWHERIDGEMQSIYNDAELRNVKLYSTYQRSYENMDREIATFIKKYGTEGEISRSEFYAYGRNLELIENMRTELERVGYNEISFIEDSLTTSYRAAYEVMGKDLDLILDTARKWSGVPREAVERALKLNIQGQNFSERVWKNKERALNQIQKTLEDSLGQNLNYSKASELLAERMNVSYSDAERLIVTESNHIITEAQANAFEGYGLKRYEIIAVMDDRTTEICKTFNGKEFNLEDRQTGLNAPPFHVRCRSTIAPAIDWSSAKIPD